MHLKWKRKAEKVFFAGRICSQEWAVVRFLFSVKYKPILLNLVKLSLRLVVDLCVFIVDLF